MPANAGRVCDSTPTSPSSGMRRHAAGGTTPGRFRFRPFVQSGRTPVFHTGNRGANPLRAIWNHGDTPRRSKGRSPLCQSGGCGFESRAGRSELGDVAQLVEASVSETDRCGFDSLHHHSEDCGRAGAPPGLISLAPGFDSRACNYGREPDNGSPERFAKAIGPRASAGSIPAPSALAPVVKRNHAALRTRRSKFESWPG